MYQKHSLCYPGRRYPYANEFFLLEQYRHKIGRVTPGTILTQVAQELYGYGPTEMVQLKLRNKSREEAHSISHEICTVPA
jgi:hypothetical protein